jgi:glycerophosphoryl diester phosphodiesterase
VTSATATVGVRLGPAITFTCALATGTAQSCAAVTIGQSVTFTVTPAAGTTGTGGTGGTAGSSRIREVVVDFGDGESVNLGAVSGATTVGHTYATAGNFTARATATDTAGEQVTSTQFIRVTGPLGLEITAQIVSGRRVRATANVTGLGTASVVQYEWTFQGGSPNSITTTPTAEFTYDSQGDKQISVRVTTTDGRTGTATTTINIPN